MNAKHYERLQDELSQEKSKPRRTKKKKSWKQISEEKKNKKHKWNKKGIPNRYPFKMI